MLIMRATYIHSCIAHPKEVAMVLICKCKEQQRYGCLFISRCLKVKGAQLIVIPPDMGGTQCMVESHHVRWHNYFVFHCHLDPLPIKFGC